jgi:hypothetical protein
VKTAKATPYLLPPDSVVVAQPWCFGDGAELEERIDHWDPFTDLHLVRVVEVDLDSVCSACSLPNDAAFALIATWASNRTRLSGDGPIAELGSLRGLVRTALTLDVPGPLVGGRLTIQTRLVLRHPGSSPSPISPRRAGAILWNEETQLALEGGAARFPITAADFKTIPRYPDTAAWVLDWDSDELDAPVLGGMRLLVNSGHENLADMLRSGSADPRAALLRSFVTFDVARSLVSSALRSDRFIEDPEAFEDGSVGRMLFELVSMCWPGVPAPTLRARSTEEPARFSAELQARFGVVP